MKRFDNNTLVKVMGIMLCLTLLVIMTGCAKPKPKDRPLNPLSDAKVMGKALGCVFAPASCKEQQAEDDREFQEEFKKIDEQLHKESKTAPKQ